MAIRCCHGCVPPKRKVGCHATCSEYLQEKKNHEEEKKVERAIKDVASVEYRSKRRAIIRAKERRKK